MSAVVAPSHRIQTIHGSFGGTGFASLPSTASAQASSFNSLPNISLSSTGRGAGLSILAARTAAALTSPSSTPVVSRSRRSSSMYMPTTSRRAPPPPPLRLSAPVSSTSAEDPFADSADSIEPVTVVLPPPRRSTPAIASRTQIPSQNRSSSTRSAMAPPRIYEQDSVAARNQKARLVASVLLSRGCGRPVRRRLPSYGGGRPYVKSGLSQMVAVEC